MWAVKGHYFTPFYNWPYTFGLLFGIGLYARYLDDPDKFRAGYDDLLSTVGMADAATLAGRFGFDVRDARLLGREPRGRGAPHRRLRAPGGRGRSRERRVPPRGGARRPRRRDRARQRRRRRARRRGRRVDASFRPRRARAYGHLAGVACPTASMCFAVGVQDTSGARGAR